MTMKIEAPGYRPREFRVSNKLKQGFYNKCIMHEQVLELEGMGRIAQTVQSVWLIILGALFFDN